MEECRDIKTWLMDTHDIRVSDDWLSACLEFIHQETNGSLDSSGQLRSLVFEQWLSSDLSEIGEPTLPVGISDTKKLDLVSSFPLQLVSIVDVGFPLFGQKQKLQGRENPNVNVSADKVFQPGWEPKPCRMLMMKLTDGHETIEAIEYRQIRAIHANLPAGTKIIVQGPLVCRRGVMMLTEENVQVLGGEVDALVESNTLLSNLEAMMERNRLDEGKASTLKLSGKFIARGSDEKSDLKCKSFIKQEKSQYGGRNSFSQIKCEPKMEFQDLNIKKEERKVKCEEDGDFQWEDDIDYDALFDDAMNSMDDVPFTTASSQPESQTQASANVSTGREDIQKFNSKVHMQNNFSTPTTNHDDRSSAINLSGAPNSKYPPCQVDDAYFDDDLDEFDVDDLEESFSFGTKSAPLFKSLNKPETTRNQQQAVKDKNTDRKPCAPLLLPESLVSQSKIDSASSSSLSQIPNSYHLDQPSSTTVLSSQKTFHAKASLTSLSTKQKLSQLNSKREAMSCNSKPSSFGKRPMPGPSMHKKSKQSKIYEWGFSASNKDRTQDSLTSSQTNNSRTSSKSLPHHMSKNIPKTNTSLKSSSSLSIDVNSIDDGQADADKDTLIVSSPSPTSSVELSSPKKNKNLSKAEIHKKISDVLPERPFEYLNDLSKHAPGESVIVKAYISTLTNKLGCAGGEAWTLSCRINDGTACLDVDLDNKVLSKLIGFSAQESIAMRQKMKSDPSMKKVLMNGLTKCQNKLVNISCLMEIVISAPSSKPLVTQFIPVTSECVQRLQRRVTSFTYC